MAICDKKIKFFSALVVVCACAFTSLFCSVFTSSALSTVSNDVNVTIPGSIALRLLDSTATTEIDSLSFDLTPVASGTALTKRTIVDVATSNPTGYKLYMQSNYQKSGSYTTDLVHIDSSVSDSIPTSTFASTLYWNYNNPLTSTTNPIPAHGTPDKIGQRLDAPTNSDQIPIDINVSVDTSIVSGTYENQLLFSAVGNPTTVNYTLTFNMSGGEPAIETMEATAKAGAYTFILPSTVPTKEGYTFQYWSTGMTRAAYHPGDTVTIYSDEEFTGDLTLTAIFAIDSYTLTVNPNGGTWSGSTSSQSFTQDYNTTKTIANPSANATYSITYNDNGQGATYTGSPTSVNRSFTGWDKTGSGEWNSNTKTYTYGAGDGSLTAQYNNTSDSFVLPAISKTGHTCYWASEASGTKFGDGGESKTITSNTTIFAYCTANQYTLTVNPNGGTWSGSTSSQTFTQDYNTTKTIANPSANATYTISYNTNSQGATYTASPKSVTRPFSSWSLSGAGSFAGGTYQFGAGNGTLTAQYSATSNSFTLPTITKPFTICGWREGSASGTYYAGGTSRTITGNTTYYASCNDVITSMHQMTSAICAATPVGSSIELSDVRESGRKYGVRKLKDGRCWMTGPLVISAAQTLKPATSDVSSNTVWNPGDCNSESSSCIKFVDRRPTSPWVTFLYNYPAATAGQNPSSGNATRSICPKGWKLPSTTEFRTLYNNYPSYSAMTNGGPQFYPYGIYWGGGSWTDADSRGLYWASNASSASNAYFLEVRKSSSGVYPSENWSKGINVSIKCVAR